MYVDNLFELYKKEREYQKTVFGEYQENPNLNLASFLNFVEEYLDKAKRSYVYDWSSKKPNWFLESKEFVDQGSAPVKTYEHLIKVFALAGAALETFLSVSLENWREEGPKSKWCKKEEKDDGSKKL
jgi:hypothetical protein